MTRGLALTIETVLLFCLGLLGNSVSSYLQIPFGAAAIGSLLVMALVITLAGISRSQELHRQSANEGPTLSSRAATDLMNTLSRPLILGAVLGVAVFILAYRLSPPLLYIITGGANPLREQGVVLLDPHLVITVGFLSPRSCTFFYAYEIQTFVWAVLVVGIFAARRGFVTAAKISLAFGFAVPSAVVALAPGYNEIVATYLGNFCAFGALSAILAVFHVSVVLRRRLRTRRNS